VLLPEHGPSRGAVVLHHARRESIAADANRMGQTRSEAPRRDARASRPCYCLQEPWDHIIDYRLGYRSWKRSQAAYFSTLALKLNKITNKAEQASSLPARDVNGRWEHEWQSDMAGVPGGMTHSRRRQATLRLSGSRSGPRWLGYPLFRPHRLESVSAASRLVRPAGSLTRALVVVESLPGGASTRYVVTYRWQVCSTWRARKHFYSTETCAEISNMVFALRSLSLPLEASSAGKFATRLPAYSPGRHTASHRLVRLKAQPSPCAVLCCPRLVSDFTLRRSQLVCLPARPPA